MERSVTVQEMTRGLWRRRKLVAGVSALCFAAGIAVVAGLPSVYRATTVVRVEPNRPSHELVQPTVTQLIEDRLKTVRQELLSRPILERTIAELNIYPKLREQKGMEAAVEELRRDLDVKVEGENAFELQVTGNDPELAAKVANRLPELYAEETLVIRERQAQLAATLYDEEIARLDKELTARDAQITSFKVSHLGELPEQLEANMRGLERVMGQLTAKAEARRELQRRSYDLDRARNDAESEAGRLKRREDELTRETVAATSRWTEDHPEVQRLSRELEVMKGKRAAAELKGRVEDGERFGLRRQIAQFGNDIAALEAESKHYRSRIDATPQWNQALTVMGRDYEMNKAKYGSLVSRKVEAELARDLETKARQSMFNVLSAASVPVTPLKPDRVALAILALLAAVGAGALAGVFRELQDDSLRRVEHAREMALPVLAVVPEMSGASQRQAASRRPELAN